MTSPLRTARILTALAVSATVLLSAAPASAGTNGIRLFFSAPFVQGSGYSGADVLVEDFNGFSTGTGACLGASAVGNITSTCSVNSGDSSGGASTTTDAPAFGGSASNYAFTPWPSGGAEIEITFPEPVQYIGFWWSAGNVEDDPANTNFIEFYHGDQLLTTMTANRVMEVLGGSVPNPYPGTGTLTTEGGGSANIGYYYGHPASHSSITPTSKSGQTPDNPFVYLNLFTKGDTRVDRVVLGGYGFEFDNFTTASLEKTPTNDMVFVNEYSDDVTADSGGGSSGGSSSESALAATGFDGTAPLTIALAISITGMALVAIRRRRRTNR